MSKVNKNPLVTAIVLNWNGMSIKYEGKPILELCLSTLTKTDYDNLKVVMIDPNSSDNSVSHVKKKYPKIDIINEKDISLSYETNMAIKYISRKYPKTKYILWLNNDLIFQKKDWLSKMVATAEANNQVGIVGCKLIYPNGNIQHGGMNIGVTAANRGRGSRDTGIYDKVEEVQGVTGAVMLIRKTAMDKVGLFDERFCFGCEDVDYCIRMRKAGYKIVYFGMSHVVHLEGFTTSQVASKSKKFTNFYNAQINYIYYALKHHGPIGRAQAIGIELLSSAISIEGMNRKRSITSIRLKDNLPKRIKASVNAIPTGYKLYKHYKKHMSTNYNDRMD